MLSSLAYLNDLARGYSLRRCLRIFHVRGGVNTNPFLSNLNLFVHAFWKTALRYKFGNCLSTQMCYQIGFQTTIWKRTHDKFQEFILKSWR